MLSPMGGVMYTDDWKIRPSVVYMNARDYRDLLIWGLTEAGMSSEDAVAEADRRMAVLAQEEPGWAAELDATPWGE